MNPEGTYSATILRGETTVSGNGTKAMKVTCNADHIAADGTWQQVSPIECDVYLYLTSDAMSFSVACLERWGFNGQFGCPEFTSERVDVVCSHKEFKGKLRERWDYPRQSGGASATEDDVRKFDAEWRATHTQPATPAGAPATPPVAAVAAQAPPAALEPPTPATPEGEEVPF